MDTICNLSNVNFSQISKTSFALDTNILYWVFYGNATYSSSYQKAYQKIIGDLLETEHEIITTTVNLNELFQLVERNALALYNDINNTSYNLKYYRQLSNERIKIEKELQLLYLQISCCIEIRNNCFDVNVLENFIKQFTNHKYDCFDFVLVEYCKKNKIKNLISDDKDFIGYDNDMNIYTCNKYALV